MSYQCVLVTATASNCAGCKTWARSEKDKLHTLLKGKVKILHYNIENFEHPDEELPKGLHPDLSRYIGFYPSFILFPDINFYNTKQYLVGIVFNGKSIVNGIGNEWIPDEEHSEKITSENIEKWIKENYLKLLKDYQDITTGKQPRPATPKTGSTVIISSESKIVPYDYTGFYNSYY
jgi:hypothetical protein